MWLGGERALRRLGVPRDVLVNPSGLRPDQKGRLHGKNPCNAENQERQWSRGRALRACMCANGVSDPEWGSRLDLKVLELLLEASHAAGKRWKQGPLEVMEDILWLQDRLQYGEGVIRVAAGTYPSLHAVAVRVVEDSREALAEALDWVRADAQREQATRDLGLDLLGEAFGQEERLVEVCYLRRSTVSHDRYWGLPCARAALVLELWSIAERSNGSLVCAPAGARTILQRAAERIRSGNGEAIHEVEELGKMPEAACVEILTTLYQESSEETRRLLEMAQALAG